MIEIIECMQQELDQALKESTAKWKFVIGHHTMMSAGTHGNTEELVAQLLPILKVNACKTCSILSYFPYLNDFNIVFFAIDLD